VAILDARFRWGKSVQPKNPPPPISRTVAAAFRTARERMKLGPAEFGAELGNHLGIEVTASDILDIETGDERPFADELVAASDISGVPLPALLKDRAWHDLVRQVRDLRAAQGPSSQAAG